MRQPTAADRRAVLTARLSGQQVMINGNALYPPSPSRLRLLPARNRGLVGAPTARRGRTTWTAARMSAISWICPLAVAKTVRWPSQKVTGPPRPYAVMPRRSGDIRVTQRVSGLAVRAQINHSGVLLGTHPAPSAVTSRECAGVQCGARMGECRFPVGSDSGRGRSRLAAAPGPNGAAGPAGPSPASAADPGWPARQSAF